MYLRPLTSVALALALFCQGLTAVVHHHARGGCCAHEHDQTHAGQSRQAGEQQTCSSDDCRHPHRGCSQEADGHQSDAPPPSERRHDDCRLCQLLYEVAAPVEFAPLPPLSEPVLSPPASSSLAVFRTAGSPYLGRAPPADDIA